MGKLRRQAHTVKTGKKRPGLKNHPIVTVDFVDDFNG